MRNIGVLYHPDLRSRDGITKRRYAARGIVVRGTSILLLFTQRYNDYSFPGGGLDVGEENVIGLVRELQEETGAKNIRNVQPFGYLDEFRPSQDPSFDLMHMTSYFYRCEIDTQLGGLAMESYELANGMRPVWIELSDAIAHNHSVMANKETSMGLSIYRETFMLEKVAGELFS